MSVPGGGGAKLYGPEEEKTRVTQEVKTLLSFYFPSVQRERMKRSIRIDRRCSG